MWCLCTRSWEREKWGVTNRRNQRPEWNVEAGMNRCNGTATGKASRGGWSLSPTQANTRGRKGTMLGHRIDVHFGLLRCCGAAPAIFRLQARVPFPSSSNFSNSGGRQAHDGHDIYLHALPLPTTDKGTGVTHRMPGSQDVTGNRTD